MFPSRTDTRIEQEIAATLGNGPIRFGPVWTKERSLIEEAELRHVSKADIEAFAKIKARWELDNCKFAKKKQYSDVHILRFALVCDYDEYRAMDVMKRTQTRLFQLSATALEDQLRTRMIFPVPGLRTREHYNLFYMRPCRFYPKTMSTDRVIDNLVYVMNTMTIQDPTSGIAFIANMDDWTMANFGYNYSMRFMRTLQGGTFPVKVELFLILNPPSWFGKVWAILSPMLSVEFRQKVCMIYDDELDFYMEAGYEEFLPDEIAGGTVSTEQLVQDFVAFHIQLERATRPNRLRKRLSGAFRKKAAPERQKTPKRRFPCWRWRSSSKSVVKCQTSKGNLQ